MSAAFSHDALFYAGDDGFLEGTAGFVRDGLAAGEAVRVVVDSRKIELLRGELAGDADSVEFTDMAEAGRNPARIIPLWREFVDASAEAGTAARGIGEPVWPGRTDAELSECRRHESLLDLAFGDGVAWQLLCPYDATGLSEEVLEEARHSHPAGQNGDDAIPDPFGGTLPEPIGPVAELRYGASDVADVRAFAKAFATDAGLEQVGTENLVLAVSELATNSIRHATGAGAVRLWTEEDTLLCEVRDGGFIEDPLVGRVVPPAEALGGRGLWIVNQLCDLVQIRSSRRGTAVRVHMSRA